MPDESAPWEAVLEFRDDDDARKQRWALRRWMRKTAIGATSLTELQDEVQWLADEYRRYMELHHLYGSVGTVEALVVTSADLIENLLKLRLAGAARSLFSLRHRRIDLRNLERSAPGRELAYIVNAHSRFGKLPNE